MASARTVVASALLCFEAQSQDAGWHLVKDQVDRRTMRCCHRFFLVRFLLPFEAVVGAAAATLRRTRPSSQWRVGTQCRTLFSPSIACEVLIGRSLPGIPVKGPGRETQLAVLEELV